MSRSSNAESEKEKADPAPSNGDDGAAAGEGGQDPAAGSEPTTAEANGKGGPTSAEPTEPFAAGPAEVGEPASEEREAVLAQFVEIPGITPLRAKALYEAGATSMEVLLTWHKEDLERIEGFSEFIADLVAEELEIRRGGGTIAETPAAGEATEATPLEVHAPEPEAAPEAEPERAPEPAPSPKGRRLWKRIVGWFRGEEAGESPVETVSVEAVEEPAPEPTATSKIPEGEAPPPAEGSAEVHVEFSTDGEPGPKTPPETPPAAGESTAAAAPAEVPAPVDPWAASGLHETESAELRRMGYTTPEEALRALLAIRRALRA